MKFLKYEKNHSTRQAAEVEEIDSCICALAHEARLELKRNHSNIHRQKPRDLTYRRLCQYENGHLPKGGEEEALKIINTCYVDRFYALAK